MDSGVRFESLTKCLNSREPHFMGTEKYSVFTRWSFCFFGGE